MQSTWWNWGLLLEDLPGLYCVIGDCAYTPSEHVVSIYRSGITSQNDNLNFFVSQLCIRIEIAFGLMVKKWGVLAQPLSIKMIKIKRLVVAIARPHNFCINKRLAAMLSINNRDRVVFTPRNAYCPWRYATSNCCWIRMGRNGGCYVRNARSPSPRQLLPPPPFVDRNANGNRIASFNVKNELTTRSVVWQNNVSEQNFWMISIFRAWTSQW